MLTPRPHYHGHGCSYDDMPAAEPPPLGQAIPQDSATSQHSTPRGPRPPPSQTPVNRAGMFTTIAVLQPLARRHLGIDSRIWPFLPPDWVKGPGVDTITFRDMLTHRAEFRLDTGLVFATDNAARDQIKHGVRRADQQVPFYNNINFTIFRDLLPFMEGAPRPGASRARRRRDPVFPRRCAAPGVRPGGRHRRPVRAGPRCARRCGRCPNAPALTVS
jgi:hypothetical protein